MRETHRHELRKLRDYYAKNKKRVLTYLALSFVCFFATLLIIGFRIMYPYHLYISLPFLVATIMLLVRALLFRHKKVARSHIFAATKAFVVKYKVWIVSIILLGILGHIFLTLTPTDQYPFKGMTRVERSRMIEEDLESAAVIMDNLELVGDELLASPLLSKKELNVDEKRDLARMWNLFLSVAIESEKITDTHRYFNQISIFTSKRDHSESFMIAYSLYVKKFELFHKLIVRIGNNENIVKVLNDYSHVFDSKNSYDDVLNRFFSSDSMLRLNVGRLYIIALNIFNDENKLPESYSLLREQSVRSYSYLMKNIFNTTVHAAQKGSRDLEKNLYGTWFPVQKNVANIMGEVYVSKRHQKLITLGQIQVMKKVMQPGDVMVQRRNWYASNLGIPGFWAHAALYIGTISELEEYYREVFPVDGYSNLRDLLRDKYPKLWKEYTETDKNAYPFAVIEAKAPGVIVQSLEESARADYVAVLRPRLSKKDTLQALLRAFENFGKPYDYNFDFETRDELVCSELVYDAYLPSSNKGGLTFESELTAGRRIVSANIIAKKYADERAKDTREFDFVYFLDGDEKQGKAFVGNEESFVTSWSRPKYSWFLE